MEQETLEEAAKRMYGNDEDGYYAQKRAFKIGALWQQEKFNVEELKFIYKIISFYWIQYNNQHEDNLKDFELSKSVLNKLKEQHEK
jgi:hypothetical protein